MSRDPTTPCGLRVGDVVTATAAYRAAFGPPYDGIVVAVAPADEDTPGDGVVYVVRRGRVTASPYSAWFWERLLTGEFSDGAGI